MKPLARDR